MPETQEQERIVDHAVAKRQGRPDRRGWRHSESRKPVMMEFEPRVMWQTQGQYEYEVQEGIGYTGWYRCVGGRLADGRWPEWNSKTGEKRYSF